MTAQIDDHSRPSFLDDLPLAREASTFAREAHREQRRESDAAQFIVHPLEVASLLHNTGHPDHLVAAGLRLGALTGRSRGSRSRRSGYPSRCAVRRAVSRAQPVVVR